MDEWTDSRWGSYITLTILYLSLAWLETSILEFSFHSHYLASSPPAFLEFASSSLFWFSILCSFGQNDLNLLLRISGLIARSGQRSARSSLKTKNIKQFSQNISSSLRGPGAKNTLNGKHMEQTSAWRKWMADFVSWGLDALQAGRNYPQLLEVTRHKLILASLPF